MTNPTRLLIVALWVASGLGAALVMGRRGHRHPYWILVSLLLGPFAWTTLAERRAGEATHVEQLRAGRVEPGLHLIVGIDGSADAAHAATAAVDLLRASTGRVTLATVVDYDTEGFTDDHDALTRSRLGPVASRLQDWQPGEAVLMGPPVEALLDFAAEQSADLIVVGPRGHGLSQRLLGSVTSGLLSRSPIPVLVIGSASSQDHPFGRAGAQPATSPRPQCPDRQADPRVNP